MDKQSSTEFLNETIFFNQKQVNDSQNAPLYDIYEFDCNHPEKYTNEVAASNFFLDFTRKCPQKKNQPLNVRAEINLACLQVQLHNTDERLSVTRKRVRKAHKVIDLQWQQLEDNEEQLKTNFIEFNKFVEENHEKRSRARHKISEDQMVTTKMQDKISKYADKMNGLKETLEIMNSKLKEYWIFQDFLQQVVDLCPEYEYIHEIVNRYRSLCGAREILMEINKANMDTLKDFQSRMTKLIEEKTFAIMGLNNQIANLQARYENANIKALESEMLVTEIKNNAVKQMAEIDKVKNSIWNMYVYMTASKKHPVKIKKENVEQQMMYINRTLTEISKVNKLIKKKTAKLK